MSVNPTANPLLGTVAKHAASDKQDAAASGNVDFSVQLMQVQAQMFSTLVSSAFGTTTDNGNNGSGNDSGSVNGATGSLASSLTGGYNLALADPTSAYNMMTGINNDQVNFEAQFAELSNMGTAVQGMQQDAASLGGITASTDNNSIQSQLQQFVGEYNAWVQQFNGDMQQGGVLAGTQAAQEARYELSQCIQSIFNGAQDGVQGLGAIGISIDPKTQLASLDVSQLNSVLAANKAGAVMTISQFSTQFVTEAGMLNQSNNFIPTQLANLQGAIGYINSNLSSLQAEFGTGAPASPSPQVSQALAEYQQMSKTTG